MSRSPLTQALDSGVWVSGLKDTPCVYDVLRHGAPRLRQLNSHRMQSDWCESAVDDDELAHVLAGICSCTEHKVVATSDGPIV